MSITQKGRGYQVSLSKEGRRFRKTFPTLSEAELAEAEGRVSLLRGEDPWTQSSVSCGPARPRTVQQLFDLTYRARWAGSKGERTAVLNGTEIVRLLGPDTRVQALDQAAVNEAHRKLRESNAGATVNRKMATLSAMLTLAQEEGLIDQRPRIPREKEGPHRTRYLTPAEEDELFSHVLDPDFRNLFIFLVQTGLRVGEARALRWQDLTDGHVNVRDSKAGNSRRLPLTKKALECVDQQRSHTSGPWAHINQGQVSYVWNRAKSLVPALSGDKEAVPHCLRHTCASRLVQAGVDLLTVQRWLGHASVRMTLIYSHLSPDQMSKACNTLENMNGADEGSYPANDA